MITWLTRTPSRLIELSIDGLPESLRLREILLKNVGLDGRLYDISDRDFGICTVLCVLSGKSMPYRVVGAAASADPSRACAKALDEAISIPVFAKSRPLNSIHLRRRRGFNI